MCHDKTPSFPPSNIDIIRMVWLTHSYNVRLPHETYWLPWLSSLNGHTLTSFTYFNIVTYSKLTLLSTCFNLEDDLIWLDLQAQSTESSKDSDLIWIMLLVLSPLSSWLCITKFLQSSMADCGNKLTMAIELNLPWFFPSGRVEF